MKHRPIVVFTDLDGTLLDHDSYSYDAALPALEMLAEREIPLVLTSSKTKAEIASLRVDLNNQHPFIVENGGAVYYMSGYFQGDIYPDLCSEKFGISYPEVIDIIYKLRKEMNFDLSGFNDWDANKIVEITGLQLQDAQKAKERDCGEPILWNDSAENLQRFKSELIKHKLRILKGGRFYHVTGLYDKATAVKWLLESYSKLFGSAPVSVALGDAGNDLEMLKLVDYPVVIPQKRGYRLELNDRNDVYYAGQPAPEGWCEAIQNLMKHNLAEG